MRKPEEQRKLQVEYKQMTSMRERRTVYVPIVTLQSFSSTMSVSALAGSSCSSICSTLMYPAVRQTPPTVCFHSRTRPSFPAEDNTVLKVG